MSLNSCTPVRPSVRIAASTAPAANPSRENASWVNGTNVTVSGTGTLQFGADRQLNRKFAVLTVDDSGVVNLQATAQKVKYAWIDGVKLDFPDKWVHLRKSNTEPIIRVYSEANTMEAADEIGKKIMDVVYSMK